MTEFDPSLRGEQKYRAAGVSASLYIRDRTRWMKEMARRQNYKGPMSEFVPRGYNAIWAQRGGDNNTYYWLPMDLVSPRAVSQPTATEKARFMHPAATHKLEGNVQGMWEDPRTVAKWKRFLDLQDDDYVPPDWLNKDQLKVLYNDLKKYNGNEDYETWKPLPFGSVGNYFARMTEGAPGTNPESYAQTRSSSILPGIFQKLREDIDKVTQIEADLKAKKNVEYDDYITYQNALINYNVTMEHLREFDPELYDRAGGTVTIPSLNMVVTAGQGEDAEVFKRWDKMEPWAKFVATFTTAADYPGRPEWTRNVHPAITAGMQGWMAAGLAGATTALIASKIPSLALTAATGWGGAALSAASMAIGFAVGITQFMRMKEGATDKNVVDRYAQIANLPDEQMERVLGMMEMVIPNQPNARYVTRLKNLGFTDKEIEEAIKRDFHEPVKIHSLEDLPNIWRAASLYYDMGGYNFGDWMTDAVSKTAYTLNQMGIGKDWSHGYTTQAGQIWQISKMLDTPQNTEYWGPASMIEAYNEIEALGKNPAKEDYMAILAKWQERYGYSGSMNDLMGQMIISPSAFIPLVSDIATEKFADFKLSKIEPDDIAGQVKWQNLKRAAQNAQGNPITDAFPGFSQRIFEGGVTIASKIFDRPDWADMWRGSKTLIDVLIQARAFQNSSLYAKAVVEGMTRVKLVDEEGKVVYAQLEDLGNMKYIQDGIYRLVDDSGKIYHVNEDMEVVKILDSNMKELNVPDNMKAVMDTNSIETAVAKYRDIRNTEVAKEIATMTKPMPGTPENSFIARLTALTPQSKVAKMQSNLIKTVIDLLAFSGDNPELFMKHLEYVAGVAGSVEGISEAAKIYGIGGSAAISMQSLRYALADDSFKQFVATYFDPGTKVLRAEVEGLADKAGVKVTDIVGTKPKIEPAEVYRKLSAAHPELASTITEADIKTKLKPFTGENPVPIDANNFIAGATVKLTELSEKYMIDVAGVKELPAVTRFSKLLKKGLGVEVIALSPIAWIINAGTNEVSLNLLIRDHIYTRKSNILEYYKRMGISGEEISKLIGTNFGLSEDIVQASSEMYKTLNPSKSWITKTSNWVTKALETLPGINKLMGVHGKLEDWARARAAIGALKYAMTAELNDIPADRLAVLRTVMSDTEIRTLKKLADTSLSGDELMAKFVQGAEWHALTEDSIETAYVDLSRGDPEGAARFKDLCDKTELGDWLRERLPNVRTPDDLDNLKLEFHEKFDDGIDVMRAGSWGRTPDNNTAARLTLYLYDAYIHELRTQIEVSKYWGELYARAGDPLAPDDNILFAIGRTHQKRTWDRAWEAIITNTYDAIREAGFTDEAIAYRNIMAEIARGSSEYFRKLDGLREQAFVDYEHPEKYEAKIRTATKEWRDSSAELRKQASDLFVEVVKKSEIPSPNGLDNETLAKSAKLVVDNAMKDLDNLRKLIDNQYDSLKGKSKQERRVAQENFFSTVYQPKVAEIRSRFVQALYDAFYKVEEARPVGEVDRIRNSPLPPEPEAPPVDPVQQRVTDVNNQNYLVTEATQAHKTIMDRADGIMAKTQVLDALKQFSGSTPKQIASLASIMDVVANTWADATGLDPNMWYAKHFGSIEQLDVESIQGGLGAAGIRWDEDGRAVIQFTKASNFTSAAHEVKHVYLRMLADLYEIGKSTDLAVVARDFGGIEAEEFLRIMKANDSGTISEADRVLYEKVSEGFVDGATKWELNHVPVSLKSLFDRFAGFIRRLIGNLKKYKDIELSDGMKDVYANLYKKYATTERLSINKNRITSATPGVTRFIYGHGNRKYEVQPIVVDYNWLVRSNNLDGTKNVDYPEDYQPRQYRADYVSTQARQLIPEKMLLPNTNFSDGLLVITDEGYVIVGNHRHGMLGIAQRDYPQMYEAYQTLLKDVLVKDYGLSIKELEGIDNPILVYKIVNPDDIEAIVKDANISPQQTYGKYENAMRRASELPGDVLKKGVDIPEGTSVERALRAGGGAEIARAFYNSLAETERGMYFDRFGNLNDEGVGAIKDTLAAYALGKTEAGRQLLSTAMRSKESFAANMLDVILEATPKIAQVDALIAEGKLPDNFDFAESLSKAMLRYTEWINSGRKISYEQQGLFATSTYTETEMKMLKLFDKFGRNKSVVSYLINDYLDKVINSGMNAALPGQEALIDMGDMQIDYEKYFNDTIDKLLGNTTRIMTEITDQRMVGVVNDLKTLPATAWSDEIKEPMINQLRRMQDSIKKTPMTPPDWMNISALYSGDPKDYRSVRAALKGILGEAESGALYKSDLRNPILEQAFRRAVGENASVRRYLGLDDTEYGLGSQANMLFQRLEEARDLGAVERYLEVEKVTDELKAIKERADELGVAVPDDVPRAWRLAEQINKPISQHEANVYTAKQSLMQGMDETDVPADDAWYYYTTKNLIDIKMQGDMTPERIMGMFGSDVAQAELKWLDIEGFIKDKPSVTKQELLAWITSHDIHVDERASDVLYAGYKELDFRHTDNADETPFATANLLNYTNPESGAKVLFVEGIQTETKTPQLFKRLLRYAIENNYDELAFRPGSLIERYGREVRGFLQKAFDTEFRKGTVAGIDDSTITVYQFKITDEMKRAAVINTPRMTPYNEVPPGVEPAPRQDWSAWNEVTNNQLEPLFNAIMDNFKKQLGQPVQKLKFDNLTEPAKDALRAQIKSWDGDIKLKRAAALDYMKGMVNHTLLDYTQKTGADALFEHVYPFHFWTTQSAIEWTKAVIARPQIMAEYYKYREMIRRNAIKGLPSRLAGAHPVYAPFLGEELGNTFWVRPVARFFPIESLTQPLVGLGDTSADINMSAIRYINQQVREGLVTPQAANEAIASRSGKLWQDALVMAQIENSDQTDPMSALSWSMLPAPWISYPWYAATGQLDKTMPTPRTRMGNAIAAQGGGGLLTTIGKLIAYPENKAREMVGLSPYSFDSNYYIDWMLSNMATSDKYDVDTILRAMDERSGPVYEEAKAYADEYLSYRLPGSSLIKVIKDGDLEFVPLAMLQTFFPAGLYPKGEMEQRGLRDKYQTAWKDFTRGDSKALEKFFEEYPEYRARLALFQEPEKRLRANLVNLLWDKWYKLSDPDKKLVEQQFGKTFSTYFLSQDTRNIDAIDLDSLTYWNRQLGGIVPSTEMNKEGSTRTVEPLEMYTPDVAKAAQQFMDLRKQKYPNYWWQQNLYYSLDKNKRKELLKAFPELQQYWDWKDEQKRNNPYLARYLDDVSDRFSESDATEYQIMEPTPNEVQLQWDNELAVAVGLYIMAGTPLSDGVKAELNRIWTGLGKPGKDFDLWLQAYLGLPK